MQFNDEKTVFVTDDNFFVGTDAIVANYADILNLPYFTYLSVIRNATELYEILDLAPLAHMTTAELLLWYINRKHFNPLIDVWKDKDVPKAELDQFLFSELAKDSASIFFETSYGLCALENFFEDVVKNKFCKNYYVYSETYNPNIEKVIHELYGDDIRYLYGNLEAHLLLLPQQVTYVFPTYDIYQHLLNTNHLDYSVVITPYDYRYNYKEVNGKISTDSPILDPEIYEKDHTFKHASCNAIRIWDMN